MTHENTLLRTVGLIIFNIGMGGLFNVLPIGVYYYCLLWISSALVGNIFIIALTGGFDNEKDDRKEV